MGFWKRLSYINLKMIISAFTSFRMSSNKAVGYDFEGEAPMVDWDWAAPAIQAYSTVNDLYKVRI